LQLVKDPMLPNAAGHNSPDVILDSKVTRRNGDHSAVRTLLANMPRRNRYQATIFALHTRVSHWNWDQSAIKPLKADSAEGNRNEAPVGAVKGNTSEWD
jgi:hypothetical protein